jgi:5-methylcytosine-specific restriction endonuclease McrA
MQDATKQVVLQLNYSFEPMAFCNVRRAARLVVKGKARIIEHDGRELSAGIMFPAVIRLMEYRHVPHKMQTLSRKNILIRDRNQCQYCGERFQPSELTLDHVHPRSKGGLSTWANLVACCGPCNRKKGDKTVEEAGLMLLHRPRPMTIHTSRFLMRSMGVDDPRWKRYLYTESDKKYTHS